MIIENQTRKKPKKSYTPPTLINYGNVGSLTKSGTQSGKEGPDVSNGLRKL